MLRRSPSNPKVWAKTVFILNYDENDGFFDHVVPPTPPAGTAGRVRAAACRSAWASAVPHDRDLAVGRAAGSTPQVFDHTSVICASSRPGPASRSRTSPAWRRAVCGDLTTSLDFASSTTTFPTLPATGPLVTAANNQCSTLPAPTPPSTQSTPTQESGTKGQRPTLYQPNVTGRYDLAAGRFWTDFSNAGAQAVPLQAYTMAYRTFANWQYLVPPNSASSDYWSAQSVSAGKYSIDVHGPNGFLRSFVGDLTTISNASLAHLEVKPSYDTANNAPGAHDDQHRHRLRGDHGEGEQLRHRRPWTFTVGGGATVTDSWATAGGWYDLTATANVGDNFLRRFAGKIETGQAGRPPHRGRRHPGGPQPRRLDGEVLRQPGDRRRERRGDERDRRQHLYVLAHAVVQRHAEPAVPARDPARHDRLALGVRLHVSPEAGRRQQRVGRTVRVPRQHGRDDWGTAVATGTFATNNTLKTVNFTAATGRYVRFRALTEVSGNPWTSCAELNVIGI